MLRLGTIILCSAMCVSAFAQRYPAKPVRLIVASAPGGGIDTTARTLATKMAEIIGQSVLVENRAGASGIIGSDLVAKSAPDGYTLLMASSSHAVIPSLYKKLPFHPTRDFAAVSLVARNPNVLVVHPSVPARSVKELIALARANPGKLTLSSSGVGRASHLAGERFRLMAGVKLTHVPYKGTGPAVIGLLSGEVDLQFATLPSVKPHVLSGRLRALAIATATRSTIMPELPTVSDSGVPGFEASAWYGVVAPAATLRGIIDTLNAAILESLASRDMKERLAADGSESLGTTPKAFADFLQEEIERWAKVVKSAGIRAE